MILFLTVLKQAEPPFFRFVGEKGYKFVRRPSLTIPPYPEA